jgi:LPXTG-motif cell wall-anchored protein
MADTDPDALEREIERTRADLARTVDAIADRMSPKRVAERSVAKVKANAEHLVSSIGDLVVGPTSRSSTEMEGEERYSPAQSMAPVLVGIGAVLVVGAAIVLLRRRNR